MLKAPDAPITQICVGKHARGVAAVVATTSSVCNADRRRSAPGQSAGRREILARCCADALPAPAWAVPCLAPAASLCRSEKASLAALVDARSELLLRVSSCLTRYLEEPAATAALLGTACCAGIVTTSRNVHRTQSDLQCKPHRSNFLYIKPRIERVRGALAMAQALAFGSAPAEIRAFKIRVCSTLVRLHPYSRPYAWALTVCCTSALLPLHMRRNVVSAPLC